MNIVHVTTVHNPFDTRIFEKMCKSVAEKGCNVTLIAAHAREEVVDGIRLLPIRARANRLARASFGVWEAVSLARGLEADIYHLHDPELLLGVGTLRRKGAVVYDMHENMAASVKHKEWVPRWLRPTASRLWRLLENILLRDVPVVFAELSYANDYPAVDCSEVVLNMPKSEQIAKLKADFTAGRKVVYLGTVTPARGSMVTLQAFDLLSRKSMGVEFICIGPVSESHLAELQEYVSRKQLRDIRFVGRLRSSEALALASECSIGLATILPLPNYVESYPTKLFEYMALGLPVVTSNFPLYREIVEVEDCGICVDPEDPQEIADAIQRLMDDPELAIEMGKRGRAAALRSYRWDIEADKLLDFYRRVLSK